MAQWQSRKSCTLSSPFSGAPGWVGICSTPSPGTGMLPLRSGVPGGVGRWKSARAARLGMRYELGGDSALLLVLGGTTGDPKSLLGLGEGEGEGEGETESLAGLENGGSDSCEGSRAVGCGFSAVAVKKSHTRGYKSTCQNWKIVCQVVHCAQANVNIIKYLTTGKNPSPTIFLSAAQTL